MNTFASFHTQGFKAIGFNPVNFSRTGDDENNFYNIFSDANWYFKRRVLAFVAKRYIKKLLLQADELILNANTCLDHIEYMSCEHAQTLYKQFISDDLYNNVVAANKALESVQYFDNTELKRKTIMIVKLIDELIENLEIASNPDLIASINNAIDELNSGVSKSENTWEELKARLME